jgi:hypothetical protein
MPKSNTFAMPPRRSMTLSDLMSRCKTPALCAATNAEATWMQYLAIDPHYDALRSDLHFQDLVRRVGLPQ